MKTDRYNTRQEGYGKNNDEFKYAIRKINYRENIMGHTNKEAPLHDKKKVKMVPARDLPLSTAIFSLWTSLGSDSAPCKNLQL